MKDLKKLLNDFAQDLINHSAIVEKGKIKLSEDGLRKLILLYSHEDDPIIWPVTEEVIQIEAESEIDRRLTGKELNRLKEIFYDDEEISWQRMVLIREAILIAIDESKYDWSEMDKEYEEENKVKGGEKHE